MKEKEFVFAPLAYPNMKFFRRYSSRGGPTAQSYKFRSPSKRVLGSLHSEKRSDSRLEQAAAQTMHVVVAAFFFLRQFHIYELPATREWREKSSSCHVASFLSSRSFMTRLDASEKGTNFFVKLGNRLRMETKKKKAKRD